MNVTVYRDCESCKLGGYGGGSSTSNCQDVDEVFISTAGNCGFQNIGKILLVRQNVVDITPKCDQAASKCSNNPDLGYGAEAHYFKGQVDFANYLSYNSCPLEIYMSESERGDNLTTLSGGETLFNFCYINPWVANNNSVDLQNDPALFLAVNSKLSFNPLAVDSDGDSLSFKWTTPLKNRSTSLSYSDGYSSSNWCETYCLGSSPCIPNPEANPPVGLYLNQYSGQMVFTPTGSSQSTIYVLEVEEWRAVNSSMTLVGTVRRDVQVSILNMSANHNPVIVADESYQVCAGSTLLFDIESQDQRIQNTDGSFQAYDSVSLHAAASHSAISISKSDISAAPYQKLTVTWSPGVSDVGTHYIFVNAADNHCPNQGSSQKIIEVEVKPSPNAVLVLTDPFCNNLVYDFKVDQAGHLDIVAGAGLDSQIIQNAHFNDTFFFPSGDVHFKSSFTSDAGCEVLLEQSISLNSINKIADATISGSLDLCQGESFNWSLSHADYVLDADESFWYLDNEVLENGLSYSGNAELEDYSVRYGFYYSGMFCQKSSEIEVNVTPGPKVSFDDLDDFCYNDEEFDLNQLNALPTGGIWVSDILDNGKLDPSLSAEKHFDQTYTLAYKFTAPGTVCTGKKEIDVVVHAVPDVQLNDVSICGTEYSFRLNNMIAKPAHWEVENISLNYPDDPNAVSSSGAYTVLDVPGLGIGNYEIELKQISDFGCTNAALANLAVTEQVEIDLNIVSQVCQQSEAYSLESLFAATPVGGGWHCQEYFNMVQGDDLITDQCGEVTLFYTYDQYGCYDQEKVILNIICSPDMTVDLPDSLCKGSEVIHLNDQLVGQWFGPGITSNVFSPIDLDGPQVITYAKDLNGCTFEKNFNLVVLKDPWIDMDQGFDALCENDVFEFYAEAREGSTLSIFGYPSDGHLTYDSKYKYELGVTDIQNGQLSLKLKATSLPNCPEFNADYSTPIMPLPLLKPISNIEDCAPLESLLELELLNYDKDEVSLFGTLNNGADQYNISGWLSDLSQLNSGVYSLKIKTQTAVCSNELFLDSIISIHPSPEAFFTSDPDTFLRLGYRFVNTENQSAINSGTMKYRWELIDDNLVRILSDQQSPRLELPGDTGLVSLRLTAISDKNCKGVYEKGYSIEPDVKIYVPTAFSPDTKGPEVNNRFKVTCSNAEYFDIVVVNKWGQMVYQSSSIEDSWDGKYMGEFCPVGIYVYYIRLYTRTGDFYEYKGSINLLR